MANVLCVFKVEVQNASGTDRNSVTISYDEKPGIQALQVIAADLRPVPQRYPSLARDYEYKRLGTVSLLASIDLHTGHVIPLVRDRHRSREFIEFLQKLDSSYPERWVIRVVLDNHSSHISKETQTYPAHQTGSFAIRLHPHPRLLAEFDRGVLQQDSSLVASAYPGGL
ncbi:MAG: transposase [Nitrososphaera sp.]|nr:transposase [Nitrososphaera sp.]